MKTYDDVYDISNIKIIDDLPVGKQVEIFKHLSSRAREELVQVVTRPEDLVRNISEEEMFFTVKELGEENAPSLLALTTHKQLLYILDVEFWKKDMLDPQTVSRWLKIIFGLGPEKIKQFVEIADPELITSILNSFIRVVLRDPEVDLLEQLDYLPSFSLDDTFYVEFRIPQIEEVVRSFLETLFQLDTQYYFNLMNGLNAGLPFEQEEMALKWRRARLADKGFPAFDEALEIYQYIQQGSVLIPFSEQIHQRSESEADMKRPVLGYPLKLLSSGTLFKRSLDKIIDPAEKDRISTELAHVANKIMVADNKDPSYVEDLQGSLKKVSGYINMSLEEVCGDDGFFASMVVSSNHMETLFRRGFSIILDLRKQAQTFLRAYEGGIENLGYPLSGLMRGLFQKRPFFANNLLGENKARDFESMGDIRVIRKMLDKNTFEDNWEPI
jgi:hypothetical protein